MRIAAVSADGKTIIEHFGRAPLYVVLTVENGGVVASETRPKTGHDALAGHGHHGHSHCGHGFGAHARAIHDSMASEIGDCQVLLAGGMGTGAYANLKGSGIEPILTDLESIDEAVRAYLAGSLQNRVERLH